MTDTRLLVAASLLLCLLIAGCAHSASGNIGVGGSFRFQLLQNDVDGCQEHQAFNTGQREICR